VTSTTQRHRSRNQRLKVAACASSGENQETAHTGMMPDASIKEIELLREVDSGPPLSTTPVGEL